VQPFNRVDGAKNFLMNTSFFQNIKPVIQSLWEACNCLALTRKKKQSSLIIEVKKSVTEYTEHTLTFQHFSTATHLRNRTYYIE